MLRISNLMQLHLIFLLNVLLLSVFNIIQNMSTSNYYKIKVALNLKLIKEIARRF